MRIAHGLGWYFPESLGGTEVYVAALSRRLRAEGHDVLIAAPDPGGEVERTYEHDGVEVFRYPIARNATRDEVQGRAQTRGTEHLHRWLERVRPDIFHCHTLLTGLGLPELERAKTLGAAVVLTCHTPSLGFVCQRGTMMRWGRELCDGIARESKCAACSLQGRGLPRPLARALAAVPPPLASGAQRLPGRVGTALGMTAFIRHNLHRQRELLRTVDAFVVLTEWARRVVAANHGSEDKLLLNRLGIEGSPPDRSGRESRRSAATLSVRFGYVGRFHDTKGIFVLADAVARLPRELPFTLELRGPVGQGEGPALRKLVSLLGSDPRVCFAPAVDHAEVATTLQSLDVLLCPSIWLEGGPTIALEAQAVGTPVVGSRIGGLAEIIEDGVNGRLVPPGDPESLAEAMRELVADPEAIRRWRERQPEPRTMCDVARDYVRLYRDCRRG